MTRPLSRSWLPVALAAALSVQALGFWLLLTGGRQWGYRAMRPAPVDSTFMGHRPSAAASLVVIRDLAGSTSIQRIGEDEIRYNGDFYDIVRTEQRGDTTFYFCRHDQWESTLFAWVDHWFSRTPGTEAPSVPVALPPLPGILPASPRLLPAQPGGGATDPPILCAILPPSREKAPPSPPPEYRLPV